MTLSFKKILWPLLSIIVLIIAMAGTWVYSQIDSSLPLLEGKKNVYGLNESVTILRDENGVPTIQANSRKDLAVATGFIHAQERFFQMDLLRKNSAGELSSLFGEMALDYDKEIRRHRFRARARAIVKQLPKEQVEVLQAYARGVNAGLDYLKGAPFEYLLLRQQPVEWQEEDTILTVLSMYLDLQQHDGRRERSLGLLARSVNKELFDFLLPKGSQWDAAIDGSQFTNGSMPKNWETALTAGNTIQEVDRPEADHFPGSNNWAVGGALNESGSAIVANDMHLGIRVPNTWFRARFEYKHEGKVLEVTGLTLPGTPIMVTGSNSNIAWGFTNSYGDWSDVITLETSEDGSKYLTPEGYRTFDIHYHVIAVKGEASTKFKSKETIWGPVIGKNSEGKLLAYRWVAHDLEAVNMAHLEMERAENVEQAVAIAATAGIPAQNLVVGDNRGNIAWTIMGRIPKRSKPFGELPSSWANGEHYWTGYLQPQYYPKVVNPTDNRLWTANSRVVGGEMYSMLGNGGYALGARAKQIKDNLYSQESFNEQTLMDIALDDRAIFLTRWQQFLLEKVLTEKQLATTPSWHEVKDILTDDALSASVDSVAYRIVRNFRLTVRDKVFANLVNELESKDGEFNFKAIRAPFETPLWQLINQQPANTGLIDNDDWQGLFVASLEETIADMTESQPLQDATWGQHNTANIKHPFSQSISFLSSWLDMPTTPLAGDTYMPRVQGPSFGASQRMSVSPGFEENGIMHVPTSQSGHPWSPYYGKGHQDWVEGKASAFLPGKPVYKLTLQNY